MNHGHVTLHNVAEVQPVAEGVRLQRVPESVRTQLNETAQMRVRQPDNCEIRFVRDEGPVQVTLSSEGETFVTFFQGNFSSRKSCRIGREPITIAVPESEMIPKLDPLRIPQPFSPRVHRLLFGGNSRDPVIFHDIKGRGIRPPKPAEVPSVRYLAYGTSITQGFDCEAPHLGYAAQAAWHLGADLINLGVGGACHCEPAFADYIARRRDWDIATLELSVNMTSFPLGEFRQRIDYLVNTVAGADPRRPVVCITIFPYSGDLDIRKPGVPLGGAPEEYREALRDVVRASPHRNVSLLEGPALLTNLGGLTTDLIHPSEHGMAEIGLRLGGHLKSILQERRSLMQSHHEE